MIPKAIESITKPDLEALVTNKVMEGRDLDYKLTLPGNKDDDKKELLADVSSFANAIGGDLVFGVAESDGVPTDFAGIGNVDIDAEKLRLEQIVRDGLAPRLSGVQMQVVEGFAGGPVLVLRVPRSFAAPHMVAFKNTSRFYTRNSAGKYQMDVTELRAAFAISESLGERLQRFRTDRLSKIVADETPVNLATGAKLVLHIVPFSSFNLGSYIDSGLQDTIQRRLRPMRTSGWNHRHNLDGFVTFSGRYGEESTSYCQFFRSGAIEAVLSGLVREFNGKLTIPSVAYEQYLIEAVASYLPALSQIGVPPPTLVMVSMLGVRGAEMGTDSWFGDDGPTPVDRDALLLPEVVVDDYAAEVSTLMRPIFDAVWNAAGFERSFNYDADGNWRSR